MSLLTLVAARARPALRVALGLAPLRRLLVGRRARPVEGERLDEHVAALMRLDELTGSYGDPRRTPAQAREGLRWSVTSVEDPGPRAVRARDLTLAGRPARSYEPPGLAAPSPGILFFHGGGWVTGDLDTHDSLCRRLADLGRVRVVAFDYRRPPEHPFPAAVDDSLAAFRALVAEAGALGIEARRIALAGDSAGGNLAAVVARRTRGDAIPPALAALIYPAVDATMALASHRTFATGYFLSHAMMEWYLGHYLGASPAPRLHPDVSPLLARDHEDLCPTLIYTAHFDPLRDEGEAYASRINARRCRRFPTLPHGFTLMTGVCPTAAAATEEIAEEIGRALRAT